MAGELEKVVVNMMAAVDRKDAEAVIQTLTEDTVGVDEISRHWLRGRKQTSSYLREMLGMVKDMRTQVKDVNESVSGNFGLVTCWIEQDYTLQGNKTHVSAPTSVVLRKEGGEWRIALFHSIPLPEEPKRA